MIRMIRPLLLCLALLTAGCGARPPAVQTAATAQVALSSAIDHESELVDAELRADFRARAAACQDTTCRSSARAQSKAAVGPRLELARRAIAAGREAASLIEQADRCPGADDACVRACLAASSAETLKASSLLVELRATRPQETP